jgi:xanthine dehydrogenase YagR molybdenum-binding subunit
MDPVQLRVLNYADTDETKNLPYSSKSLKECYRAGADRFGWSRRNPQPGSMRDGRFHVGYGMATATYPANYRPAHARAEIDGTGRVLIQCGTQDLGTGSYTILTQLAADNLGVDPWLVRVEIADTSLPEAPGSGGSTSAASAGSAVAAAAQSLRGKILALASTQPQSPHNGVPQEQLDTGRGQVFAKSDPSKSVAYAELVARAGGMLDATEAGAGRDNKHAFQSFGAQFCEVQVDPDFGTVRVTRWVGAFAIGRALNMKTLESQLRGGIVFGIGMGLMEETFMDDTFGRYVNTNLAEYHVPVNRDIPAVEVIVVPEEDPYVNPIGVKGAGEIGITGAAAAIANAVNNATGKRVRDLPITLDKVMA